MARLGSLPNNDSRNWGCFGLAGELLWSGSMTNHASSLVEPLPFRPPSRPVPAPRLPAAALLLVGLAAAAPSVGEAQQVRIHIEVFADEGPDGLDAPPSTVVPAPSDAAGQEAPAAYREAAQPPHGPALEQPAAPTTQPPYPLAYAPPLVYAPQLTIDPAIALQESLRRQRIGGPIAMMAAGLAMGCSAALIATDPYTYDDERSSFGVVSAMGFGLAIAGVSFLIRRLKNRSRIRREIRALQTPGALSF